VKDLVDIIYKISKTKITSFQEFNVPSDNITIENLAYSIAKKIDGCKVLFKEIPENIKKIDSSGYQLNCEKLLNKVSYSGSSNLELSLEKTIGFFKDRIQ
jgi:nucleoside-diphosphate-sugar epimerase